MTEEEKELLARSNYWSTQIEEVAAQIGDANLDIKLPAVADRQLRNLAEAASACEQLVWSFVYRRDPSEELLRLLAGHLGRIHRRLDDIVLPATVLD